MALNKKTQKQLIIAAVAVVAVGIIGGLIWYNNLPGQLDGFAQCIKDKKTVFYGAFWCPHCQNEKKLFGKSARLLPYVECSTPDGQGTTEACQQKNITQYPTWIFADGSQQVGEMTLAELSTKTGCSLTNQ